MTIAWKSQTWLRPTSPQAIKWYRRIRLGLAADFLLCVDETIARMNTIVRYEPAEHWGINPGHIAF